MNAQELTLFDRREQDMRSVTQSPAQRGLRHGQPGI